MKTTLYFVSFKWETADDSGIGNCEVMRTKPVSSMRDLNELSDLLREQEGFDQVIITNWRRFDETEE